MLLFIALSMQPPEETLIRCKLAEFIGIIRSVHPDRAERCGSIFSFLSLIWRFFDDDIIRVDRIYGQGSQMRRVL